MLDHKTLILMLLVSLGLKAEEKVELLPILNVPFGQIAVIEFMAIAKGDSYYSQNIDTSKFSLKIISINGKKLDPPIIASPTYSDMESYEIGSLYTVRAYENVNSENEPRGWVVDESVRQFNYWIIHKIVIAKSGLTKH